MTQIRVIIEDALRKIGVVAHDEPMTADQVALGMRNLSRMLKTWGNHGIHLWSVTSIAIPATTARSYDVSGRPLRVHGARYKADGIETPMTVMTRGEYDALPQKLSTGLPTTYYYDLQRDTGTIYVWPVLAAAAGTFELTVERELSDVDSLNASPDFPNEYEEAAVYGLAARLAPDFGISAPAVEAAAGSLLQQALAADREGSVFFYGPDA